MSIAIRKASGLTGNSQTSMDSSSPGSLKLSGTVGGKEMACVKKQIDANSNAGMVFSGEEGASSSVSFGVRLWSALTLFSGPVMGILALIVSVFLGAGSPLTLFLICATGILCLFSAISVLFIP